ncbi:hypothetical protein U6G28_02520 [Actinomycetaceae bacterium MB13-C1-2]|nr:hypothetical protein U6G28_02520 [Actinomycetaceae bacterium MB13-C1-2]
MSTDSEATIGTVEWEGHTYEIDWPFYLDEPSMRDEYCAVVYEKGRQLAELPLPGFGETYKSAEQIMDIAFEFIAGGGLDDH